MLLALLSALLVAACIATPAPGEQLIFQDHFDSFNLSIWKHEITLTGDGNWCFEWYGNNRSVSSVSNGTLIIKPVRTIESVAISSADLNIWGGDPSTACTNNFDFGCERQGGANIINPITSASLRTAEAFSFKYGRVEVVAQLPRGDWLWPAIWMMPVNSAYGGWPVSGEIDIMESRGNARGYPGGGVESIGSTLHFGPYCCDDASSTTHAEYALPSGDFSSSFHTFGFFWNESIMETYVDDTPVLSINITESFFTRGGFPPGIDNPWSGGAMNAPFDQRFYLKINVAVGGTNGYFPDGVGGKPWQDNNGAAANEFWAGEAQWAPSWASGSPFIIDSVSVWQTPGTGDFFYRPMP